MNYQVISSIAFFLCYSALSVFGQNPVENASFEGEAQDATTPVRWHECSDETTPDILPGFWGVTTEASDGDTYMGLITRDIGTWEAVGQRLQQPLQKDYCYNFAVDLAHSSTYAGYNLPVKFKVWGCKTRCSRDLLIGEVPYVDHSDWKTYKFQFTPEDQINYVLIEVGYIDGLTFHYKGNMLVDNCSAFELCQRAQLEASIPASPASF